MSSGKKDKRRAPRVPVNAEFAEIPGVSYVGNLSEVGVFIHTSERANIGEKLVLRFTVVLDDAITVEAVGRVVRHSDAPSGMAFEFSRVREMMTERIHRIIAWRRPVDSGPAVRPGKRPGEAMVAESQDAQLLEATVSTRPITEADEADSRPIQLGDVPERGRAPSSTANALDSNDAKPATAPPPPDDDDFL